jgi:transcriptional regulator with XRE-family HTH domain
MVGRTLEDVSLLEALRADKGLTQYVAAAEAGMSHKTLKKYEHDGLPNPRLDVLDKLGRYYNVRTSLLLEDVRKTYRRRIAQITEDMEQASGLLNAA